MEKGRRKALMRWSLPTECPICGEQVPVGLWEHVPECARKVREIELQAKEEAQNLPCAHSMDTTWFAVDKNGLVGEFWSSEGGCVPRDAPAMESALSGRTTLVANGEAPPASVLAIPKLDLEQLVRLKVAREIYQMKRDLEWSARGRNIGLKADPKRPEHVNRDWLGAGSGDWRPTVTALLHSVKGVGEEIFATKLMVQGGGKDRILTKKIQWEGKDVLLFTGEMTKEEFEAIHKHDLCVTCIGDDLGVDHAVVASCFLFRHPSMLGNAPYTRVFAPASPKSWSELGMTEEPELVLPVDFRKIRVVQPAQHVDCEFYGDDKDEESRRFTKEQDFDLDSHIRENGPAYI